MKKVLAALTAAVAVLLAAGCDLPFGRSSDSSSSSSTFSSTSPKTSSSSTDSESTDKSSSVPEEPTVPEESGSAEESSSVPEKNSQTEENSSSDILGELVRTEVKEAIDSYESFINEYCEFMKKYAKADNPLSMMSDYMSYLQKLKEMEEKLDNLDSDNWTAAETAYYTEVMLRCQNKLLEAAGAV